MYLSALGGAYTVRLEIGADDIIRVPHRVRTGTNSKQLPAVAPVLKVSRTMKAVTGKILHLLLNHCNPEKMYQTLLHTRGFKPVRFEQPDCVRCALGKSTWSGLSNKRHSYGHTEAVAEDIKIEDRLIITVHDEAPSDMHNAYDGLIITVHDEAPNDAHDGYDDSEMMMLKTSRMCTAKSLSTVHLRQADL